MSTDDSADVDTDLLPPGTAVDLDNCAREPIHIPGSIQPRGVLLAVRDPELVVTQASANLPDHLGIEVDAALGAHLSTVIGVPASAAIERAVASFSDLRDRNPLEVDVEIDGGRHDFDAILHRMENGLILVELEAAYGPRPFSFPNTYLAVRSAVGELNQATSLQDLYDIAARAVRELTGFDRVMVYRYDRDYNGEVVAEAKRDDLNSFLGLHYPSTDIPAQARALYEKNWIRLISDIGYTPSPLVPTLNPVTGAPLDLTFSTLRSVSPIHVEYLQNMGVGASMSISLLRGGRLWGLIACHHYSGPHTPPYGTRAAAEFLGSTLSLRLVDRFDDEALRSRLATQNVLAKITAGTVDERQPLTQALLGAPDLLDLISGDGVVVSAESDWASRGVVPEREQIAAVARWARESGETVAATDMLSRDLPDAGIDPSVASGALAVTLPSDQFVIWFRAEEVRHVDWGGDPHNKAIAVQEGDGVRLSPRRSFDRWRETVRHRSLPWTDDEFDVARQLQHHSIEAMYQRARHELRLAETLQRSLLPTVPTVDRWDLSAFYEPAAGGRLGGDWYDAFVLSDGRLATVLGDVAGHGIGAAGTMAQLRNVLRAYLHDGLGPAEALAKVNDFTLHLMRGAFATAVVACVDRDTGEVSAAMAGHPRPFVITPDGPTGNAVAPIDVPISPPIGVLGAQYRTASFTLAPGETLLLFSDGLIERRGEDLDVSRQRLAEMLAGADDVSAQAVWESSHRTSISDDATIVSLRRGA